MSEKPKIEKLDRDLEIGVYLPPPRAERHLTKPLKRYGLEKTYAPKSLFTPWHS
jgi:tRNA(Ile2) C34 agmatinyltransferase TiaS